MAASIALSDSIACHGAVRVGGAAREVNGRPFPLLLEVADAAAFATAYPAGAGAWVSANQPELESLLASCGALVFRGFPLPDAENFSRFVKCFGGPHWIDLPYEDSLSYAVRTKICDRVCSTNEGRLGGMVWHHEQAQAPKFPRAVFFYCQVPADAGCGGATGIAPSSVVYERLAAAFPDFAADCAAKGVRYHAVLPPHDSAGAGSGVGRSWRSFWRCDSRAQAEERMRTLGYTWMWQLGDVLRMTTPTLPAVIEAPGTEGRKVFFNQMIAQALSNAKWFLAAGTGTVADTSQAPPDLSAFLTFGDGSPVSLEALQFAAAVSDDFSVDVEWQQGDVALIDNYQTMHARRAWSGDGPRKVLASLVNGP